MLVTGDFTLVLAAVSVKFFVVVVVVEMNMFVKKKPNIIEAFVLLL